MGMANLNAWVTRRADGCHIHDDPHETYYFHITDCSGKPLVYCGKNYTFLEMKCGHLSIDVPPGCYTVFASHTPRDKVAPKYQPFGNRLTHVQIVRANCGDHVCVTLFAPGMHYCGTWFKLAVETQIATLEQNNIDVRLARDAVKAVDAFLAKLEPEQYNVNVMNFVNQTPTGRG